MYWICRIFVIFFRFLIPLFNVGIKVKGEFKCQWALTAISFIHRDVYKLGISGIYWKADRMTAGFTELLIEWRLCASSQWRYNHISASEHKQFHLPASMHLDSYYYCERVSLILRILSITYLTASKMTNSANDKITSIHVWQLPCTWTVRDCQRLTSSSTISNNPLTLLHPTMFHSISASITLNCLLDIDNFTEQEIKSTLAQFLLIKIFPFCLLDSIISSHWKGNSTLHKNNCILYFSAPIYIWIHQSISGEFSDNIALSLSSNHSQ